MPTTEAGPGLSGRHIQSRKGMHENNSPFEKFKQLRFEEKFRKVFSARLTHFLGRPLGRFSPVASAFYIKKNTQSYATVAQ